MYITVLHRMQHQSQLDDSAFLRTQSYITEICYFEYLQVCFLDGKNQFSPQFKQYIYKT